MYKTIFTALIALHLFFQIGASIASVDMANALIMPVEQDTTGVMNDSVKATDTGTHSEQQSAESCSACETSLLFD